MKGLLLQHIWSTGMLSYRMVSLLIVLFLSIAASCNSEEINIPLTLHEALRTGISGVDRREEPVTAGLPFPRGVLYEENGIPQLALKGVSDYQFRTLDRWPDGSVKWALIDFQISVKSGETNRNIHVVRGGGTSPGKLAEDKGDVISVNTSSMIVQIRKKGFNLFDKVAIEGMELVKQGSSRGIVVVGENGEEYLALMDTEPEVLIEENGPVRAVIKAEGTHAGNGKRMLNYTVRMHFYKGKSKVKVFYTLRNASKEQVEHAYIRSLDLITKVDISGEPNVVASKHNGIIKEHVRNKDDELVYYQAVSDFPQEYGGNSFYYHAPIPPDYKREKEKGFIQEGYWIKNGEKELERGMRKEYPDLAFLDVNDGEGKGVTVGIRFAAGWWPKDLRVKSDGTVCAGLWPKENEAGYWIRYGSHNTFEIMYDFHLRQNDPNASMKKFQYPLVAKASVDWYNHATEGIYPLYNFVSFNDEKEIVNKMGWEYRVGRRSPKMKIWRYHYWGWGGFLNQHDFARIGLVNFLRETEDPVRGSEYFLGAEARFNYNADWAIFHSDDYDSARFHYTPPKNEKVEMAKVVFEIEHMHWYGLPLYYYLTGDERIKEVLIDWGEVVKSRAKEQWILVQDRVFGWEMYSLAAMYNFTGDSSFMEMADELFKRLLMAKINEKNPWSSIYIDWDRGFIMRGSDKLKPGLMTGYIIFDGLYNYYLTMDEKNPLKERVGDVLEGLSEFLYREPYFEGTKGAKKHWAFWLPYIYNIKDKSKSNHGYRLITEAFYVNLAPFLLNGESKWLERMDKIIRQAAWDEAGLWGGFGYMDHPGLQSILYQRLHMRKDTSPPFSIGDLSASGKERDVVLKWSVPVDTLRYQIKFSPKKLVESVGFDPDTRIYKYDPKEYVNWWAGENIPDEPPPGKPGMPQNFTVKRLKPGHYYFAIRSWNASNNRSNISNLAEVEIR